VILRWIERNGATMNWAMLTSKTAGLIRRFASNNGGATAIEYSLIAAGIAGAIIAIVMTLGTEVKTKLWDKIADVL
jgi:pilus assembly protein Flp/PilA